MAPLFCYWEHICACGHHVKLYWESHPGVMIYDQIEPVEFFFFSSLSWVALSSPDFEFRIFSLISSFLLRVEGIVRRWHTCTCTWQDKSHWRNANIYIAPQTRWRPSGITEWRLVRCALLLFAQRWRGTVPSTPHELQKPVRTDRTIHECIWHLFRITVSLVTKV